MGKMWETGELIYCSMRESLKNRLEPYFTLFPCRNTPGTSVQLLLLSSSSSLLSSLSFSLSLLLTHCLYLTSCLIHALHSYSFVCYSYSCGVCVHRCLVRGDHKTHAVMRANHVGHSQTSHPFATLDGCCQYN